MIPYHPSFPRTRESRGLSLIYGRFTTNWYKQGEESCIHWRRSRASGDGIAVPYTLYELEVLETLKGETNDLIYVIGWDPDFFVNTSLNSTPVTDLREGETVVLYLEEGTPEASPTITITDRFYVTLGIDNGVFDVVSAGASGPVGRVNDDAVVNPRGTSGSITKVVGRGRGGIEVERTGLILGQTQTQTQTHPGRRPVQCR